MIRLRTLVLALALIGPCAAPTSAQDRTAATIAGILDLTDRDRRLVLTGPTRRALVRRSDSNDWIDGRPELQLFWADRVLVEPRTLVRLGIRTDRASGEAMLSADLQTPAGALVVDEIGGRERAIYEIREGPQELGDLELLVARGSLALDWARGRLVLWAGGIRSVVTGTRLVVAVDSVNQRGFIHLVEGSVTFPDHPDVRIGPGEWAVWEGTAFTTMGPPARVAPERLAEAAQWTIEEAWPRPFYRRAWPYLAVLGAVGGYFLLDALGNEGYEPPRQR